MDTDLVLTLGAVLFVLAVPSLLSSWVEGQFPRMAAVIMVAAIAMVVVAQLSRPGGYRLDEVPGVVLTVLARALP